MPNVPNLFILAAGFGERLRPITSQIPKPLLPILGKPILTCIVQRLYEFFNNPIAINIHYKKSDFEIWRQQMENPNKLIFFPEDPILGSGGALKNAENFLSTAEFITHNADIISNIDLHKLLAFHRESKNLVTLAVNDIPQHNHVAVDAYGMMIDVGKNIKPNEAIKKYVHFASIAVYSPEFLRFLPHGNSSVLDAWKNAICSGEKIGTFDANNFYWRTLGTPVDYKNLVMEQLQITGKNNFIHPSVRGLENAELHENVVIEENCVLEKGVRLKNCLVLPGSHLKANTICEDMIFYNF